MSYALCYQNVYDDKISKSDIFENSYSYVMDAF